MEHLGSKAVEASGRAVQDHHPRALRGPGSRGDRVLPEPRELPPRGVRGLLRRPRRAALPGGLPGRARLPHRQGGDGVPLARPLRRSRRRRGDVEQVGRSSVRIRYEASVGGKPVFKARNTAVVDMRTFPPRRCRPGCGSASKRRTDRRNNIQRRDPYQTRGRTSHAPVADPGPFCMLAAEPGPPAATPTSGATRRAAPAGGRPRSRPRPPGRWRTSRRWATPPSPPSSARKRSRLRQPPTPRPARSSPWPPRASSSAPATCRSR